MRNDFRRTRAALLLALAPLLLTVYPPAAQAQQNANAAPKDNAAAARPDDGATLGPTETDNGAAMGAAAARMLGDTHENQLLGAPAPYGDPYRSQFENESNGAQQTDLINSQSVPMSGGGDKAKPGAKQGTADALAAGKPGAQQAQAQPRTPANAAKSVYRGSADPLNPDKQHPVYKSPW
ncbi:hypothetical protein FAZ69_07350 [Trinickia terrae]|uniref:DUF4148 domain-containing protein n=1 Tax=Trinickia terrae TaxID=2571161 RepID=A0A4V5PKX0_9BURK|nr:hypothetical protein [Trinickia terrae]TKC91170.1 hypothetical protein FAZ69_07350 [Trinickia terrae]